MRKDNVLDLLTLTVRRQLALQRPQLMLAVRGTAAALISLAVAVLLRLESPYWAAMTAIIVIQPTRGLLLEKSYYRLVGTAIGSTAGLLLMLHVTSPLVLTLALSLWLAGCVGIGNLIYGLRSYAILLAGCTCAIIGARAYQTPLHLHDLAFGRIAGTIVGIMVATTVTLLFTPRQSKDDYVDRLRRVSGEAIAWLALLLRHGGESSQVRLEQEILLEIAEIESLMDVVGAGSLRFKRKKRHIRSLVASLLSLLAAGRSVTLGSGQHASSDDRLSQLVLRLEDVAGNLKGNTTAASCIDDLQRVAAETAANLPLLGETLTDLVSALRLVLSEFDTAPGTPEEETATRLIRHRDWNAGQRAALRAAVAILTVGLIWQVTGWKQGAVMLMPASIMVSLFSTRDFPADTLVHVFVGASIGSAAALFCRLVLLPGVTNPLVEGVVIAPLILLGVFAMQYRQTVAAATDATLIFMFVEQPGVPLTSTAYDLLTGAFATVAGIGIAWASFHYLIPINPAMRMRSLLIAIVRDLLVMTESESSSMAGRLLARLQHRVIRLVAMAKSFDANHLVVVEGGLAALVIGRCIQRREELEKNGLLSAEAHRAYQEAVAPIASLLQRPEGSLPVLESAAARLCAALPPHYYHLNHHGQENQHVIPSAAVPPGDKRVCFE
ncbi:FUSC family protein [Geobacter grbiciae]|uniref:FUSC family protein n=1 Tax=Geobacter grbiciae TaxID=155042 RepID=UPI001FEA53AB|nr:FUSC family protein [Geobacter grbiciae]